MRQAVQKIHMRKVKTMGSSRLGSLLVKEGRLSDSDRKMINRTSGNRGAAFAKTVVALGIMDETHLANFLVSHSKFQRIGHSLKGAVSADVIGAIDHPLLERLEVVPIALDGKTLTVAMVDPLDVDTIHQLKFFTGYEIKPVIATFSEIYDGLEGLLHGFKPSISNLQEFLSHHMPGINQKALKIQGATQVSSAPVPDLDLESIDEGFTDFGDSFDDSEDLSLDLDLEDHEITSDDDEEIEDLEEIDEMEEIEDADDDEGGMDSFEADSQAVEDDTLDFGGDSDLTFESEDAELEGEASPEPLAASSEETAAVTNGFDDLDDINFGDDDDDGIDAAMSGLESFDFGGDLGSDIDDDLGADIDADLDNIDGDTATGDEMDQLMAGIETAAAGESESVDQTNIDDMFADAAEDAASGDSGSVDQGDIDDMFADEKDESNIDDGLDTEDGDLLDESVENFGDLEQSGRGESEDLFESQPSGESENLAEMDQLMEGFDDAALASEASEVSAFEQPDLEELSKADLGGSDVEPLAAASPEQLEDETASEAELEDLGLPAASHDEGELLDDISVANEAATSGVEDVSLASSETEVAPADRSKVIATLNRTIVSLSMAPNIDAILTKIVKTSPALKSGRGALMVIEDGQVEVKGGWLAGDGGVEQTDGLTASSWIENDLLVAVAEAEQPCDSVQGGQGWDQHGAPAVYKFQHKDKVLCMLVSMPAFFINDEAISSSLVEVLKAASRKI